MVRRNAQQYIFGMIFFGIVSFIFIPSAHAATVEFTQSSGAESAVVNLYCQIRSGNKIFSSSGSGVFIHEKGVILTNAHVAQYFLLTDLTEKIKGECTVRTGNPAKATYTADILYIPSVWLETSATKSTGTGENDFALLYVTGAKNGTLPTTFPFISLATTSPSEESVVTVRGYPTEGLKTSVIQKKLPQIQASSTVTNLYNFNSYNVVDVIAIAESDAGSAGISGGAVTDTGGDLAAIVTTKGTGKNSRALRAITVSYIDRALQSQLAISLNTLTGGNYTLRNMVTEALLPKEILLDLQKSIFKKKK